MKETWFWFALALFLASTPLSCENLDSYISRRIREDLSSPCMDKVMTGFTDIGSRNVSLPILVGLYTLGNEKVQQSTKLSAFSVGGAAATCVLIKLIVNRKRPCEDSRRINSSFPSSHAAGAFAFTYVMSKRHPQTTIPLYLTASTISFSRIYLGRHYVSDVIIGTVLGITAGWLVMMNKETLLKVQL